MEMDKLLGQSVVPGGYAVERQLGAGGMGVVYLVRSQEGQHRVLKIMRSSVALDEWARDLFIREMINCQVLDHPNVVRTYDVGNAGGLLYLMMEFCDGGSLDGLVAQGIRPLNEALAITYDVLAGLEYAHTAVVPNVVAVKNQRGRSIEVVPGRSEGVVHRDLKPQNIFLAPDGGSVVAKVGDFGLAKAYELAGESGITPTGPQWAAGTLPFMPRQQVLNFKYARPEVDVWATAATLYFMLTGRTPRDFPPGKDPWSVVSDDDPVPILNRGVELPPGLAQVIDEALLDKPEIKFKSAAAFRAALAAAQ